VLDRGPEFREKNELNVMLETLEDRETQNNAFFNKLRDSKGDLKKPAFNEVKTGSTKNRLCTFVMAKNPADLITIRSKSTWIASARLKTEAA
jgi:hypothetical protein